MFDMAMRAQGLRLCIHEIAYKNVAYFFFATVQRKKQSLNNEEQP